LIRYLTLLILTVLLTSCVAQPIAPTLTEPAPTSLPSTASEAQQVLIEFFTLLNEEKYAEADALYGGSYQGLQDNNPDVEPSDHTTLWSRGCKQNGLQCLKVRSVTFRRLEGNTHVFQVEFSNTDGSLFVRGPCCGASETDMPPQSQFEYKVARTAEGTFVVMDTPPYVP
jgi:hypothetical protein